MVMMMVVVVTGTVALSKAVAVVMGEAAFGRG